MIESNHLRGWPIYWDGKCWRYNDNHIKTVDSVRPCGACGKIRTPVGHDGCLGTLPGVSNACCGHGHEREAYIQFEDGTEARGVDALHVFDRLVVPGKQGLEAGGSDV